MDLLKPVDSQYFKDLVAKKCTHRNMKQQLFADHGIDVSVRTIERYLHCHNIRRVYKAASQVAVLDKCCVKGCKSSRENADPDKPLSFFRFPKQPPERRNIWVEFAARKKCIRQSWKMCGKHFISGKASLKATDVDYVPTQCAPKRRKDQHEEKSNSDSGVQGSNSNQGNSNSNSNHGNSNSNSSSESTGRRGGCQYNLPLPSQLDSCSKSDSESSDSADDDPGTGADLPSSEDSDDEDTFYEKTDGVCPVCQKFYEDRRELKFHVRRHRGLKPEKDFFCHDCNKQFASKWGLKVHIMSVHEKRKDFICDICGREYARKIEMREHRLQHTDESPSYLCPHCVHKPFTTKSNLRSHIRNVHSVELRHVCEVCGHGFTRLGQLRAHTREHTGEKPYSCTVCHTAFAKKTALWTHELRVHNSTRHTLYSCCYCGKKFLQRSYVLVHERTHTGEKPNGALRLPRHLCQECGKSFKTTQTLDIHIKRWHGPNSDHVTGTMKSSMEPKYLCPACPVTCGTLEELHEHVKTHDEETLPKLEILPIDESDTESPPATTNTGGSSTRHPTDTGASSTRPPDTVNQFMSAHYDTYEQFILDSNLIQGYHSAVSSRSWFPGSDPPTSWPQVVDQLSAYSHPGLLAGGSQGNKVISPTTGGSHDNDVGSEAVSGNQGNHGNKHTLSSPHTSKNSVSTSNPEQPVATSSKISTTVRTSQNLSRPPGDTIPEVSDDDDFNCLDAVESSDDDDLTVPSHRSPEGMDSEPNNTEDSKSEAANMGQAQAKWHSAVTQFFVKEKVDPKILAHAADIYNFFPKKQK